MSRVTEETGAILVQPLLDHNADRCGRKTEDETREPKGIQPYGPPRCGRSRREDPGYNWLSRVDEWRIDEKAVELDGNLLECSENRVWRSGREELVRLDYESCEHGGEKTGL